MKNLMTRALNALGFQSRAYASAKVSRLTSDWRTFLTSADEEIWTSLRMLRARSRALLRDDDYFKHYVRKLKNNVVGHKGMTMKVEAEATGIPGDAQLHGNSKVQKDRVLNKKVEDAWSIWTRFENASASQKLTFLDQERLAVEALAVDGEFLFRKIFGRNAFGYSLQQLDPDWLDENYNEMYPKTGNRIVMSVELDVYDRPVAYHLTPPRHSYYGVVRDFGIAPEGQRVRIDASEIVHGFIPLRPGQTRGVPMGHTVLGRIRDLDRYEEAEIVDKTVSAAKMGFLSPDKDNPPTDIGASGKAQEIKILDRVEPGMLQKLPAGWHFEMFDPKAPSNVFAGMCKQLLRGIAAGLGISYNSLANDLEGVNYSSLRQGALDERDEWKAIQQFMIQHFYEPVYAGWIEIAIGSPYLQVSYSVIDRVSHPCFRPRGWDWVDPQKDAEASAVELAAGTTTYTEVLAEKGRDFEETMEQIKYERDYIKELGLTFVYGSGRQAAQQDGEKVTDGQGTGQQGGGSSGPNKGSSTGAN